MDLVEFLRARLDEDEAAARAASPGPWRAESGYEGNEWAIKSPVSTADSFPSGDVAGPGYEGGGVWGRGDAEHIARHDPARVLAEVEAKRRIVDECNWGGPDHADVYDAVLRRLALPYVDHAEYRPEWKP